MKIRLIANSSIPGKSKKTPRLVDKKDKTQGRLLDPVAR